MSRRVDGRAAKRCKTRTPAHCSQQISRYLMMMKNLNVRHGTRPRRLTDNPCVAIALSAGFGERRTVKVDCGQVCSSRWSGTVSEAQEMESDDIEGLKREGGGRPSDVFQGRQVFISGSWPVGAPRSAAARRERGRLRRGRKSVSWNTAS
ncbi:hypothetical protein VDGL01_04944 [Verticillium dahliae]